MVKMFFDVAINVQLIRNGIVVTTAIGFRPNRSINGPTISEPIGSDIVTSEAGKGVAIISYPAMM